MGLKKLTDKIYYFPHQTETDRPMLAYIKGDKFALAIDAGNSANHVDEFYATLDNRKLNKPDFTAITHWHWDHTFGLHKIHGLSIANKITNKYLSMEAKKLSDSSYAEFLKTDDECFAKEYARSNNIVVVPATIQFENYLCLNLGGITAEFKHITSPHSDDTTIIYVREEKILFLGDATSEDFYNDGYMDKAKLQSLINSIKDINCTHCILGHTEPLKKSDLLTYLKSIL